MVLICDKFRVSQQNVKQKKIARKTDKNFFFFLWQLQKINYGKCKQFLTLKQLQIKTLLEH